MISSDVPLPTLTVSLFTIPTKEDSSADTAKLENIEHYWLQMEFEDPGDAEKHDVANQLVTINRNILTRFVEEDEKYGVTLSGMLFGSAEVRRYFEDAWLSAFRTAKGMRFVLSIDSQAPWLHGLHWERLCHPRTGQFLFTDANLPFSRYLEKSKGENWSSCTIKPKKDLKALLVVANPVGLEEGITLAGASQSLGKIDIKDELSGPRSGLKELSRVIELARYPGQTPQATMRAITQKLADGVDILYLVCHGVVLSEERKDQTFLHKPYLLLEDEEQKYAFEDGAELVAFLRGLDEAKKPRLIVLASCQSAGTGMASDEENVLMALGPQLAQAGIPAVVAMQGSISMDTVKRFMPVFFAELSKDGQIERAMALARNTVAYPLQADWWFPVLFTRLKNGILFDQEPPSERPLENYLRAASQEVQFPRGMNQRMKALWNQPFMAHQLGSTLGEQADLFSLIRELFKWRPVDRFQRAVMLGATGQGKSGALKTLRTNFASEAVRNQPAAENATGEGETTRARRTIPIYLSLNDLRPNLSLVELAVLSVNQMLEGTGSKKITVDLLNEWVESKDQEILFLVDDLEALITRRYGVGLPALFDFMNLDPFNDMQFLVACRSSSYQGQLGSTLMIEMEDLRYEQVQKVLGEKFLSMSPHMQQIARNRSMLAILLDVEQDSLQTKGQLTQVWVEKNLGLQEERVEGLDTVLVKQLLEQLAYEMRSKHMHVFSEDQLRAQIGDFLASNRELYNWRYMLFVLRNIGAIESDKQKQMYSFAERTYADYFAAAAVLHHPERYHKLLEMASDYWWRDVLELLIGLLPDPDELIYDLIDRDVLAAAHCVGQASFPADSAVITALVDGLVEYMDSESSSRRKRMVDRINEHKNERVPEVLLRRLHREWSSYVLLPIIRGLEGAKKQYSGSLDILVTLEAKVRDTIVQDAISTTSWLQIPIPVTADGSWISTESKEAYLCVLQQMMEDQQAHHRLRAMAALSLGLSKEKQVLPILMQCVCDPNEDDLVAWCAAEGLIELGDPALYQKICLQFKSQNYEDIPRIQSRLIYLLGRSNQLPGSEVPCEDCESNASWRILLAAADSPHPIVSGNAILTMARMGFRDANKEIERHFRKKTEPFVIKLIAEALAFTGTPETIQLLERKMKDPTAQQYRSVRSALQQSINEIKERYNI